MFFSGFRIVTIHDQFVIIATYFIPAHEGSHTSLPQKDVLRLVAMLLPSRAHCKSWVYVGVA
jgi:hypothetical protein